MLQNYKHISFDLDGTLVHTVPEYRHALVPKVVQALGGSISGPEAIDRFWFESGRDAFIRGAFKVEPDLFWGMFRAEDSAERRSAHTRAYHDSEKAIRKLKDMDKTVSIVTGAPHEIAEMEIKKLNGAPHDYYLSTTSSGHSPKPDPKSLHFVLDELELKPEETLYIGNSNEDAFYAKNAGVGFVYLERDEYQFDLKDYSLAIIKSLYELFELK